MPRPAHTRASKAAVAYALRYWGYVCHLCGHPGAFQGDHLVPLSQGGDPADWRQIRPAHGHDDRRGRSGVDYRCPVCRRACNQERGNRAPVLGDPRKPYRSREW